MKKKWKICNTWKRADKDQIYVLPFIGIYFKDRRYYNVPSISFVFGFLWFSAGIDFKKMDEDGWFWWNYRRKK